MQIAASIELPRAADAVWSVLRDFNGLPGWYPGITESVLEGDGLGAIRRMTTGDGQTVRERLEAFDDHGRALRYALLEGPLPVANYEATLSVTPTEDRSCVVDWVCTCEAHGIAEPDARALIEGVYALGLEALRAHVLD